MPLPPARRRPDAAPPAPARSGARLEADATLLQLMRGILYPASNVVFAAQEDLAKYTPPADPSTSPNPITSTYGGWQAVENASLAIAEATKLIAVSGRMCSSNRLAPVDRADWKQFTEGLRQAALKSYRAAQTKSTDNMLEAAGDLSDACYMCHAVYREKARRRQGSLPAVNRKSADYKSNSPVGCAPNAVECPAMARGRPLPTAKSWRLLLSLASGAALALAYPDYNLPLLGWIAVAGLIFCSLGAGLRLAAACGLLFGLVHYVISLPWIYTVLREYGPLPGWQAAALLGLLSLAAAVFWALFAGLLAWLSRRGEGLTILAAPFLWVALELLRTHLPDIGFPWNLLGYTASNSLALLQIASVTGIFGLSLLVAGYNSLALWALLSIGRARGSSCVTPARLPGRERRLRSSWLRQPAEGSSRRRSRLTWRTWCRPICPNP